jgi:hypothetical protein
VRLWQDWAVLSSSQPWAASTWLPRPTKIAAISLAIMLGPLAQALVGLWITAQITFAIGVALSLMMALVAFLLLKNPGLAENV